MYRLLLKIKSDNNILSNQSVFWYPIKISSRNQLISLNISSFESYALLKKRWGGRRIAASFPLTDNNIAFIYFGDRGNKLMSETFGERTSCVRNGGLNYFFSEDDAYDIYIKIQQTENKHLEDSTSQFEIEKTLGSFFENHFKREWLVKFQKIDDLPTFSSRTLSPNPILHLFNLADKDSYSKEYYKDLSIYLLQNDFLVKWIDPKQIPEKNSGLILKDSIILSKNEIKNMIDLSNTIQKIVMETFSKWNEFSSIYLAVQCGNERSIIKKLFKNLYMLLPNKEKSYIGKGYANFQPKALIECIEIHFIQRYLSKPTLENIIISLTQIFDRVEYYTLKKANIENIDYFNRYRFFCEYKFQPAIDCNELKDKMENLAYSINNILMENGIYKPIGEMWVKSIRIQVLTPPQFEDDFLYAVSHIWPISRDAIKDFTDPLEGIKTLHFILHCDYPVYKRGIYVFSLNYSHDVQLMYSILNERLYQFHNFSIFPKLRRLDN